MPNQNRITVVVDIAAEADKLNKVLEQSKKQLGQISPALNDTQLKNFTSQLDKLQKKLKNLTKNQILTDASSAMLAQSLNINRSAVAKLLG